MTEEDPYRRAVGAAIHDLHKPLAKLTPDEVEQLYERALGYFIVQNVLAGRRVRLRGPA